MSEPTFEQLSEQVQRLTMRVAALEGELGLRRGSVVEEKTVAAPEPVQHFVEQATVELPVPRFAKAEQQETRVQPEPGTHLESSVGLQLVNRVGAITLILGIAFFFRYAVERNWIGETVRVLLGIAAGVAMLGGGEFAFRRGQRVFAQGVTGAGAAIVYLAIYAAFGLYELVSWPIGFLGLTAATGLAAYLATRYASQAIAALALFGGFLAPALFEHFELNPWFLPVYIGFLVAGFLALARSYRWVWCEWLALVGTALFTGFSGTPLYVMLGVYYVLFAMQPNARLFVVAHAVLLGRATFISDHFPVYAMELAGMSGVGVAVIRWRGWFQYASVLVTVAAISWFAAADFGSRAALWPASGTLTFLFALFFVAAYSRAEQIIINEELLAIPLTAAFYFVGCYRVLSFRAEHGSAPLSAALLAVGLGGLYFGMAYRFRLLRIVGLLSAGIAIAFLALAIPIGFSSFRITVAWALEGAALVWIGAKRGSSAAQNVGLLVLLVAVFHFYILCLSSSNARFVTALGLAAALFLSAVWMRTTTVPRAAPGVAGHIVLLTAIALEITDWATKHHAGNEVNVTNAAISIVFAAYAVGLVALGTGTRTVANRYLGLLLIALVVVKLYLYDVWHLDVIYRFIAFAALGALLLTMSYLYSRYRDRIAGWLQAANATRPGATPLGASATHPPQPPE